MAGKARYVKIPINDADIAIYASPKHQEALTLIRENNDLYGGVRLLQLFEEVYKQGKKDGARETFASLDRGLASAVTAAKKAIPHRNPGRCQGRSRIDPVAPVEN